MMLMFFLKQARGQWCN